MATWRFIGSNSLTFTRDEDATNPQTPFNRKYCEIDYINKYFIDYKQKVNQTDDLWFQFRTDYNNFTVYLVDSLGTKTAQTVVELTTYDNWTYYQVNVDVSSLEGVYYIQTSAESDNYKAINNWYSNEFHVKESHPNTLLKEWYGNAAIDVPMIWGDKTQEFRVEGTMFDMSGFDAVTSMDSDNNDHFLSYKPVLKQLLQIELLPSIYVRVLNIAIGHDTFKVNGQVYTAEGGFEAGDRLGQTLMYIPKIELKVKDYQNYSSDPELTGTVPTITSKAIKSASGFAIKSASGKAIKVI